MNSSPLKALQAITMLVLLSARVGTAFIRQSVLSSSARTRAKCFSSSASLVSSSWGPRRITPSRTTLTRLYDSEAAEPVEEEEEPIDHTPLIDFVSAEGADFLASYQLPDSPDYIPFQRPGQRLVCIGDVHGDFRVLKKFLKISGVCSSDGNRWTGGDTILVQCGDILDRGDEELACFQLFAKLGREAQEAGGRVVMLYGNHEALNAAGLFHYAFEAGNAEYESKVGQVVDKALDSMRWRAQYAGNAPARWAAMEPGGLLATTLLRQLKVVVQVGRTVCVHAGLTENHLKDYGGVEGMNKAAREWIADSALLAEEQNPYGQFTAVDRVTDSAQRRAKTIAASMPPCLVGGIGAKSPVWMRDYSQPADLPPKNPNAQRLVDAALEAVGGGADKLVMGHTPQQRINGALEGKVWRVDVGASKGVNQGTPEVLEVTANSDGTESVHILTASGERVDAMKNRLVSSSTVDARMYF